MTMRILQRATNLVWQARAIRAVHAPLEFTPRVRRSSSSLTFQPGSLSHTLVASAKIPTLDGRNSDAHPAQNSFTPSSRWKFFHRLPKYRAQLTEPALRVKIARRIMRLRMHDRIVRIHHHNQPFGISVKMQVPDDRGHDLRHRRPATRAQRRLHDLHRFAQHAFDQHTQSGFVRRRFTQDRELHAVGNKNKDTGRRTKQAIIGTPPVVSPPAHRQEYPRTRYLRAALRSTAP